MTDQSMTLLKGQLAQHEGVKRSAYQDSKGFWTIGVGRLIDARRGGGLRESEIYFLLENDIVATMSDLDQHLPWWRDLDDVRQRVMIELCFNMGIGVPGVRGLLSFSNTLRAIQEGRYDDAADGLLASKWARDVKETRANRIATMMRTGRNP